MKIKDYWYMVSSFLFTLIIPIIFLICYQNTAYEIAKTLVEQSNQRIVKSSMLQIESRMNNIQTTFDKLSFENDINAFYGNRYGYKGSSDLYIVKSTKQTLEKYSHYFDKSFVSDIFIFNPLTGIAVSKSIEYIDMSLFYNAVYKLGDYTYPEFMEILQNVPAKGRFLPNEKVTIGKENGSVISYIRPMFNESNQRIGYLIAHIRTDALLNEFSALNYGDTGYFTISDSKGNTLYSLHPSINETQTINPKDYYITKLSTSNSQFSYEIGIPKTYISKTIKPMHELPIIYIMISIFTGIGLSIFLSYMRIRPISELFNCFEPNQTNIKFNSLSAGLHKIIEENSDIKIKLSEQFILAKYDLIHKVFNGDIDEDEIEKTGQTLDCPVSDCHYIVIDIADKTGEQTSNLFLPAAETALINAGFVKHYMLPYKGKSVSCFACIESNNSQMIYSMVQAAKEILYSVGGFKASFYLGSIVDNLIGISQSKKEADFLFTNIDKTDIFIHDLMLDSKNFHYPIKIESTLIKAITEGNAKKVGETLDSLFATNLDNKEISLTIYKRFVEGIINTFFRIDNTFLVTYKNKINMIEEIKSIKRSCIELRQLAFSLTEKFQTKNVDSCEFSIKEEIMNYVKSNYCDSGFTILELADKFNMSYDSMYNFFKKKYNKTFSTVVEDMRIKKSIELLKTDESIDNISKLCGYNCSHSFRRAFTKKQGFTPSAYREQLPQK